MYNNNILRQVTEDEQVIKGEKDYNDKYLRQFQFVIGFLVQKDRSQIDTLGIVALNLVKYSDMKRSNNIFQSLLNSGEVRVLKNQTIIEQIQGLEETYIYINRLEEQHFDLIIEYIGPFLNQNFDLASAKIIYMEKVYSVEFQNLILTIMEFMHEKQTVYQKAIEQINTLKDDLSADISKEN